MELKKKYVDKPISLIVLRQMHNQITHGENYIRIIVRLSILIITGIFLDAVSHIQTTISISENFLQFINCITKRMKLTNFSKQLLYFMSVHVSSEQLYP